MQPVQQLEFLLEEQSMGELLKVILPKILPEQWQINHNVFLRAHEGKSDLQKSIKRKFKAYKAMPVGVIVLHDQDASECKKLKDFLVSLCQAESNIVPFLVRIVCKELESWYLGDMKAIELAYPGFKSDLYSNKAKFRNPDICNAKDELRKILPELQQLGSAKAIAPHLDLSNNKSESFNQFKTGLERFVQRITNSIEE